MLQQTRVAAVLAYYDRFMASFRDVRALADATEAEVLARWSGLGYYRRARMMRRAAQVIVHERAGAFPETAGSMRELPGIGRYTAAAIASIAFGERVAVVDGNVERVLERITGKQLSTKLCWEAADQLIEPARPGDWNQALMELGAVVCTPKAPKCSVCPVFHVCRSRGKDSNGRRAARSKAEVHHLLRVRQGRLLLQRRAKHSSLMASMWELPMLVKGEGAELVRVKHSITTTDYSVRVFDAGVEQQRGFRRWTPLSDIEGLPLTGLTRKILRKVNILDS